MQPDHGTLVLVLGILSLVLCGPVGIAAWILGNSDLKEIDAGRMDPAGRSTTNAGRICGMIGTAFTVIGVIVGVVAAVLFLFLGTPHAVPQ